MILKILTLGGWHLGESYKIRRKFPYQIMVKIVTISSDAGQTTVQLLVWIGGPTEVQNISMIT